MNKIKWSALVMTYKAQNELLAVLHTLFPVTDEIIIVDGSWYDHNEMNIPSDDDTLNIIDKFKKEYDKTNKIKVFSSYGREANARSIGLAQCTGDYVLICDSDEIYRSSQWEVIKGYQTRPDIGSTHAQCHVFWWNYQLGFQGACRTSVKNHKHLRCTQEREFNYIPRKEFVIPANEVYGEHPSFVGFNRYREKMKRGFVLFPDTTQKAIDIFCRFDGHNDKELQKEFDLYKTTNWFRITEFKGEHSEYLKKYVRNFTDDPHAVIK